MPVAGRPRTSGAPDVASNAPLKISFPDVKQLGRAYRLGFYAHVLYWVLVYEHPFYNRQKHCDLLDLQMPVHLTGLL